MKSIAAASSTSRQFRIVTPLPLPSFHWLREAAATLHVRLTSFKSGSPRRQRRRFSRNS
jgi:hypothetical protein